MILADEYTLTGEQEERLLAQRAEDKRSRWWAAPYGSPAPGPEIVAGIFIEPWPSQWAQLNDPATDPMVGVAVLNEQNPAEGLLIWVDPTEEATRAWSAAATYPDDRRLRRIGVETNVVCDPPESDYRAVFLAAEPLPMISRRTIRWRFRPPVPGAPGWETVSAGYIPEAEARRRAAEAETPSIEGTDGG